MLRILAFSIICLSIFVSVVFFMPWVSGEYSVLEPLDDYTEFIQKIEPTGIIKGTIEITKKTADVLTYVLLRKRLKKTLSGFAIPLYMVRSLGIIAYLLYVVPIAAIIFCFLTLIANKWKRFDLVIAFAAFIIFYMLYKQERLFNQEKLFTNFNAQWGFVSTVYTYLSITCLSLLKFTVSRKRYKKKKIKPAKKHKK